MPAFISKLQYTNCEQGEFFDEQVRAVDTTIQLINDFPWESQRRYIDNSLTGPSVTIQNEQNYYLKVSIHNGSEFWVLLLKQGRLYEYPVKNLFSLDEAIAQVRSFFNNLVDISKYKLLRFELFAKRHFASKSFIYKRSIFRLLISSWLYLFFFAISVMFSNIIIADVIGHLSYLAWALLPLTINVYLIRCLFLIVRNFIRYRNTYIKASYAHNDFIYCKNGTVKTYYKDEIQTITMHTNKNSKGPNSFFAIYELHFKDGSSISYNNIISYDLNMMDKIAEGIEYIHKRDFKLKML